MRLARTAALLTFVVACRGSQKPLALAPSPASTPAPAKADARKIDANTSVPLTADLRPTAAARDSVFRDSLRADSVASQELARTVVAVFGDTAGIADSMLVANDVEPEWDMDVRSYETHARVAHYIDLFSGSARERFTARLARGARYEPMIRAKLKAGGLPEDMTYLALVESGYDPHAYSRAAAVGMWQFMSSTARDVGMRVDWWVDERRDPARSTDGAIAFLRDLQKQFGGSLYLAAAAYNGGPGRVSRGLTRFASEMEGSEGEDRFFALADQDYLRAETKDYVPQLIASAIVAKMPARYGITVGPLPLYEYDSVRVEPGTSLAAVSAASGSTTAEIRELNPSILRGVTPPDIAYWVKVPLGRADTTRSALDALPESSRLGYSTRSVSGNKTTLAALAAESGVSSKAIAAFNPGLKTTRSGRLVAGQKLRIPAEDALAFARDVPNPSIEIYGSSETKSLSRSGFHVVRRGESLGGIAKRYGLTSARLKALNGLKGTKVVSGQTLRVRGTPKRAATSRAGNARKAPAKKSAGKSAGSTTSAKKGSSAKKASSGKSSSAKASNARKPTKTSSASGKSSSKTSGSKGSVKKSSGKSSARKSSK
jgi:membrane-bound lytic murein transglycosylase D